MKIILFLPDLYGGGAERVCVNLANHLSKKHEVHLVLVREFGPLFDLLESQVHVKILGVKKVFMSGLKLYQYVQQIRADVILSALDSANIVATLVAKIAHIPNIVTIHDYISLKYKDAFYMKYFLKSITYASEIVSVSMGVKEDLKKYGIKSKVIYNPVVSHLKHSTKEKVIVAIGRLEEAKDFRTLINAFRIFNQKYKDYKLFILGEGSQKTFLKNEAFPLNIYFLGFVNPDQYLSKASLLVNSSVREPFGLVLVEALSYGVNVVATKTDGAKEVLAEGKYGFLAEVGNSLNIASAMEQAIENPIDEDDLKQRAKVFSIETITLEYEKLLVEVCL